MGSLTATPKEPGSVQSPGKPTTVLMRHNYLLADTMNSLVPIHHLLHADHDSNADAIEAV
jgi:hypothetical protein